MLNKFALILTINFLIFSYPPFAYSQTQSILTESAGSTPLPTATDQKQESSEQAATIKEDPYKDLPKSGVLSGTYSLGADSKAVSGAWAKKEAAVADSGSPVTGSVSRVSAKQWKAAVFNNSEDDFSVSIKVRQIDARSNTVKTDNFSMRLKAKSSDQRLVSSATSAISAELELVSWKKL